MQLSMPLICLVTFLFKYQNTFGGAVATWWLGHSCIDIAPYAHDARSQSLMLLGGVTGKDVPGYHDWNDMLGQLGWLRHDHAIAAGFYWGGAGLMALALIWGAALLVRQWGRRPSWAPTRR